MTTILIADASKPSLVMTSEIFKDKIPGAIVLVARTGQETMEMLAKGKPDLCVVDFDLPDTDGPALVGAMRKIYQGPILMTAYPDSVVEKVVNEELFDSNDAGAWVSKPVSVEQLSQLIDRFLIDRHRLGRRFDSDFETRLVGKASGRGKRAPKVKGKIINISMGGACVELAGNMKVKKAQELTLTIAIKAAEEKDKSAKAKGGKAKAVAKKPPAAAKTRAALTTDVSEAKLKATVAWVSQDGQIGLEFSKLTDLQKKGLVSFLRYAATVTQ